MYFTDSIIAIYLAIKESVYQDIFTEPIGGILIKRKLVKLLVFEENAEEIVRWIP
ncbi:MAG: element excision factor XisH family protein [Cyanobacteriota bacterium]|nr:element excision factor XisH family protein [Cyanobacteriota bacterium]